MNANEAYKAGRLQEAIDAQLREVKAAPADHGKRLFLFELLAFAGDWDRARRQLDAVRYDELEREATLESYRKVLDAETLRRKFFSEGVKPRFLVDPPEHVNLRLEAVTALRGGQLAEAAELLNKANAQAPAVTGQLNGKRFTTLRDGDDLLGTVLEVFAKGAYFWAPLEQIDSLALREPRFPRDVIWAPARMEMDGSMGEVFLPAIYRGSSAAGDDQLKLGRATDWKSEGEGPVHGVGARTFLVDEDAIAMLEWRELLVEGGVPPAP